jgi:hypothetical protein
MANEKNITISELARKDFQKSKLDHLKAFMGVRTQKDLANQPVIAERPVIPVAQLPQPMGFTSGDDVKFSQTELQAWNIKNDFINKACQSIKRL